MKLIGDMYFPDTESHFQEFASAIQDYQRPQREKAFEYVTDWSLCLDIGANVGIFSRHFASRFEQVWAMEPLTQNIECLERNVPDNVRIIPAAAGDTMRDTTIILTPKTLGNAFICDDPAVHCPADTVIDEDNTVTVPMITVDSLELERLGLIKLDIQGAELIALQGARETLLRLKPVVLIEEKPLKDLGGSIEHIKRAAEFLTGLGMIAREKMGADRVYIFKQD